MAKINIFIKDLKEYSNFQNPDDLVEKEEILVSLRTYDFQHQRSKYLLLKIQSAVWKLRKFLSHFFGKSFVKKNVSNKEVPKVRVNFFIFTVKCACVCFLCKISREINLHSSPYFIRNISFYLTEDLSKSCQIDLFLRFALLHSVRVENTEIYSQIFFANIS